MGGYINPSVTSALICIVLYWSSDFCTFMGTRAPSVKTTGYAAVFLPDFHPGTPGAGALELSERR